MNLQVTKDSLREQIVTALRGEIISSQFSPGQQLVERQLATRFGVSVAPVREALLRLVHEGFLDSSTHRSVRVAQEVSQETREILTKMRIELEISALRLGFSEIDLDSIAVWQANLSQLKAAYQDLDYGKIVLLDFAFHRSIFEASHQPELLVTWMTTMANLHPLIRRTVVTEEIAMQIHNQHSQIIKLCQASLLADAVEMLKCNIHTEMSFATPDEVSPIEDGYLEKKPFSSVQENSQC